MDQVPTFHPTNPVGPGPVRGLAPVVDATPGVHLGSSTMPGTFTDLVVVILLVVAAVTAWKMLRRHT